MCFYSSSIALRIVVVVVVLLLLLLVLLLLCFSTSASVWLLLFLAGLFGGTFPFHAFLSLFLSLSFAQPNKLNYILYTH